MNRQKMDKQKRGPLAKITLQKLVDNIVYAEEKRGLVVHHGRVGGIPPYYFCFSKGKMHNALLQRAT